MELETAARSALAYADTRGGRADGGGGGGGDPVRGPQHYFTPTKIYWWGVWLFGTKAVQMARHP
jgi:hypothetical protein